MRPMGKREDADGKVSGTYFRRVQVRASENRPEFRGRRASWLRF
jgi:hypothetical protein